MGRIQGEFDTWKSGGLESRRVRLSQESPGRAGFVFPRSLGKSGQPFGSGDRGPGFDPIAERNEAIDVRSEDANSGAASKGS
jgi:hypothetical protein